MELATRPLASAGVVLLAGASAIVATPAAPPLPDVQTAAVQLTSGFDDITFAQVLSSASASFTNNIWNPFIGAPFPTLQQVGENLAGYVKTILTDPSAISNIPTQIQDNLTAALNAPGLPFYPIGSESYLIPSLSTTPITVDIAGSIAGIGHTGHITIGTHADLLNDLIHGLDINIFGIDFGKIDILSLLLGSGTAAQALPYLDFVGSPLSGVLWGEIGTDLSPIAQLLDDGIHISDALNSSDYTTVLADLAAIPANVTNAFLEGYGNVANLLGDFGISSGGFQIDLGGLLSPGGSLFNALGFSVSDTLGDCSIACVTAGLTDNAMMVGPIASLIGMGQAIAQSIGWDDVGSQLSELVSLF